jgi:glycosyltransferase involved in cell wall biosynthesis
VTISVIIPAFNEEALLADSLRSICAAMKVFDELNWMSELIVCDNNSTDRTASIARAAGAAVCVEPVNQIARARNTGAAHATGDWLVFVDADSCPSAALFTAVGDAIRAGRCLAGGSTVHLVGSHHYVVTLFTHVWNALSRITKWAAGSLIFCEAAAFQEVGGFSEELYAGEEIDLFRRFKRLARRRGRTIVILHEHPLRTSDRKVHLYTLRELLSFLARTLLSRGQTLRSARTCFAWYDGRR